MKQILVYDAEYDRIEKLCEKYDTHPQLVVEALFDALDDISERTGEENALADYL